MRSHTEYTQREIALYKALRRSQRKPVVINVADVTMVLAIAAQAWVCFYLLRLLLAA